MDLRLAGKKAIVLGGTRGIGRRIADNLISEGASVGICARNPDQVAATVTELTERGGVAIGDAVDITDRPALKAWIHNVAETLGGIDVLISNAGAMAQGGDIESWIQNFHLDVLGGVAAFEAAEPHLTKAAAANGDAAMVLITSVSAAIADQPSSYGPMKAALIHFAKGLARAHASKGIRVNTVSPGMVYFEGGVWEMAKEQLPEFFEKKLARNPTGRCATPEEVADAAVFLASPRSSYTSGANLIIDGAMTNRVNH